VCVHLDRVLNADAPGKRQWWKGCCGMDLLAGSEAPGMTSTGMAAASSLMAISNSLPRQVRHQIRHAIRPLKICIRTSFEVKHTMSSSSKWIGQVETSRLDTGG
jgi:hypothetical protein